MGRRLTRIAGGLAGLVVVLAVAVAAIGREQTLVLLFGPIDTTAVSFATLVPSQRPNRFLVCPDDYCRASADLPSPIYKTPAAALRDRWLGMISRQPRVERTRISADGMQFDFVQRSWLLRFPDTITVRFIDLDDGRSTLAVYSRSHYGHSDLGVNRQRIKAWLAAL